MAYSDKVIDHYENPRNVGRFVDAPDVGTGLVGAPACFSGDTRIATPDSKNISLEQAFLQGKDIPVWSYNQKSEKFEIQLARPVYSGRKQLHEILVDGEPIWVTPDHKFLMVNGDYKSNDSITETESITPFFRMVNRRGYWSVRKTQYHQEHLCYYRYFHADHEPYVHEFIIDHADNNKRNNSIENLCKLSISDHRYKSHNVIKSSSRKRITEELSLRYSQSQIVQALKSNDYNLQKSANDLNLFTDNLYDLCKFYAIKKVTAKTFRVDDLVRHNLSTRMKNNNPYHSMSPEWKRSFASHPGNNNGRWIDVDNQDLIRKGREIYDTHGKLTAKLWSETAKNHQYPQNLSPRFQSFDNFKQEVMMYNHKIKKTGKVKYSDCYTLQVEVNNNYVVVSQETQNIHSGIVVKNCGDVMRLQIRVDDQGIITDAVFKTFGCFTGNTFVNTPSRATKMRDLRPGDEVLAWNGVEVVPNKIKEIITRYVNIDELLAVEFQREPHRMNMKPGTFKLICTREHVFWNADNTPILAKDLVAGQELYELTEYELRKLTNIRHRPEFRKKLSERMYRHNANFDHSTLPQTQAGYVCKNPHLRSQRVSEAAKRNWQDPEYVANWRQGMSKIDRSGPTSIEREFIDLFEAHNIAVKYSAGKVWIQTDSGPASPDFIVPGKKKCIEVYTKRMPAIMEDRSEESDYVERRTAQLASAGYETLCVAVEDIHQAVEQVQNFVHNGMKILSINPIKHGNELRGVDRNEQNQVKVYDLKLEDGAHVYFTNRVGSHNCGSAIASSSLLTEWVKGKNLDQAAQITNRDIAQELSLPPVKIHCSVLAEDAIHAAIQDYKNKSGQL